MSYNIRLPHVNKTKVINKDTLTFFHFGCWNRETCLDKNKQSTDLEQVVKNLETNKEYFDFGIINGDNVYPDKEKDKMKKTKTFPPDRLIDGFKCINRIGKPLYVTLGNHDIEDCNVLDNYKKSLGDNISVYDTGRLIIKTNKTMNVFLFINTNFMDMKDDFNQEVINVNESCYHQHIKSKSEYEAHKNQVVENLKENLRLLKNCDFSDMKVNIFVVGHNPLIAVKEKKEKYGIKYYGEMKEITDAIFMAEIPTIYYLSADVHNYQNITITDKKGNVIHMIASGTGGAKPDILEKDKVFAVIEKSKNSVIDSLGIKDIKINDFINSYGYNVIEIDNEVKISYIKVKDISLEKDTTLSPPELSKPEAKQESLTAIGGYYDKYMKYKLKYMELKNMYKN